MRQLRDAFNVKRWRVSWTSDVVDVRVSNVFTAKTRTAARRMAERAHPKGTNFRVGRYHGGTAIPRYHAQPA